MTSAVSPGARWRPWAPVLLGVWAAAVAVAPSLPVKLVLAAPAVLLPVALWTMETPGRWIPCFFAAALLLPPLPIAWGDTGPHPSLWFAVLGLLAGILGLRRWRIPFTGLNAALGMLLVVLLASVGPAAIHSGAAVAAGSLARVALLAIGIYIFWYTAHGPGSPADPVPALRGLYWAAVGAALFACVDFYFQFPAPAGYGPQFVWLDSGVYRRAQGLFYEASTLGNFCAFFLVMIAVCWSLPREQAPVSRKALAAGGAVFFTAMVLSYSRASLVNVAVGGAVLAWRSRRRFSMAKLALVVAICTAAGALLTWALFPALAQAYWLRLSASAEYLFSATEGVLSGRLASWRTLEGWISAHPWQTLLGIGYKTLPYSNYLGAPLVADNMYLSLLVETGVAGLAALLWLNVAVLRAAARASESTRRATSFCGTWMLCFWAGQIAQMFSGDLLTYWRVLPLYFWVLALAVRA